MSNVTYFNFHKKAYYLCVIIDLYARKVIAWKISQRNTTHLTKGTFQLTYFERFPATGLIYHRDNEVNFTSYKFCKYLKDCGIKHSFSVHIILMTTRFANLSLKASSRRKFTEKIIVPKRKCAVPSPTIWSFTMTSDRIQS